MNREKQLYMLILDDYFDFYTLVKCLMLSKELQFLLYYWYKGTFKKLIRSGLFRLAWV